MPVSVVPPIRHPFAAGMALIMLLLGLSGTWLFYRGLVNAESASIERYVDNLADYVRGDILASVNEQIQAQQRKAGRLARSGLDQLDGFHDDVRIFMSHYPYYESIAVYDADLQLKWQQGRRPGAPTERRRLPIDEFYQDAMALSAETGNLVVIRPQRLSSGESAVTFVNPIGAGNNHRGFLAAAMIIPQAVDAMISELFRDELMVRVTARDEVVYPFPELAWVDRIDWRLGFVLDLDDDGTGFRFEFGIAEGGRESLTSVLPQVALFSGFALTLLLAIIVFLGLNATRQARILGASNHQLEREIRERELAEQELEFLVTHDPLTGLPNRTGSTRYLERILLDNGQGKGQLALLFLDLDQFKDINDSLGHQLGDRLLCEIPRRLAAVLKDRDFVGRHGGDEFLIAALRNSRDEIEHLAANILRSMDTGFAIDDNRFFISASIGIAYYPESGDSVSELIQNADAALFKAKNAGRNQFAVFTREMFSQAQHRLNLSRDIRHALDAGQFRVVYQPIVSVKDLSLCGMEALLRWEHEKGYMVPPQDFIRVAEETGVIGRLGQFAMEQALSDLARWKRWTDSPPWLAVNISGVQVRESGFAEQLSVLLHRHRIEPELLHLEITEEVLIENLMRNRRMLQKLDDIGMRIVVDDFGVGYSSLAYLKNFPISVVKIDRGFIQDLASDREDQAITRTICGLASDLGMMTVAEGVEHKDQLDLLREFKCSFAQGFLFSRPVEADAVEPILRQRLLWLDD